MKHYSAVVVVHNHLIIGRQRYISLKERGLGFPNT